MQSLNIYWESYVPGDGATKVRKTQSLPSDRSTETNKKAIPTKCWEREAHRAKEVLPHPNHAGRFFWRRGVPLLWKGKQSQAEEPKVPGEGNNGISGRARASLKVKESDVFVELEVAQCGWSAREVRHGSGEWLDYRSTCVKPTKLIFQDYVREWAVIFLLPLCQGQQTFL